MREEMSSNDTKQPDEGGGVNLGRHQAQCTICSSPYRQLIEQEWVSWHGARGIAERYGVSRDAIYRHAQALDLASKRQKNIRMALEQIIERVDMTAMNGSHILSAIKTYMKINSEGQGGENVHHANAKDLLAKMAKEEREAFAKDGSLPAWFLSALAATPSDGQEGENGS